MKTKVESTVVSSVNSFLPRVACYKETSHLICSANQIYSVNQMTGFYMKYNTRLNRRMPVIVLMDIAF